jgi:cyclohexa-1,5-dienecarbonyl-CoA hydratase
MAFSKIRVEPFLGGAAKHVVLQAPKANVLDAEMLGEINELLDACKEEPGLKLLCFRGEGAHFSFGASVAEHVREQAPAMLASFHGIFRRMAALAIPTAAVVRGRCLGGGMELATFCNWVYAHPGSVFAQPEVRLGVLPPIASIVLPFKIGQSRADDINLTGRDVTAEEALRWGLVDVVAEDPLEQMQRWADREIAPKSAVALRLACKASRWALHDALQTVLPAIERLYLEELMATHDATEGIAAFLEKRSPAWRDR